MHRHVVSDLAGFLANPEVPGIGNMSYPVSLEPAKVKQLRLRLRVTGSGGGRLFWAPGAGAAPGPTPFADERVAELVRAAYDFQQDPQVLYSVRRALGDALEEAT